MYTAQGHSTDSQKHWISFWIVSLLDETHMVAMVMHGRVISKADDYVKKAAWAQPVLGLGLDYFYWIQFFIGSD